MIVILSPAKTLNMEKIYNTELGTMPQFINEAVILIQELRKYTPPQLEILMKVNMELAEQNFLRHLNWKAEHYLANSKQALLAYSGAVYHGINAGELNEKRLIFANEHIRILSGLYGALRPLDLIQPYRLEMAAKLKNPLGNNLYSFWRDKLTEYFKREIERQKDNTIINLASKEYSSAVDMSKLNVRIITPVFKDYNRGSYKIITIYTKRARGLMSRFIIENGIVLPEKLKEFEEEDYQYAEHLSSDTEWVFIR